MKPGTDMRVESTPGHESLAIRPHFRVDSSSQADSQKQDRVTVVLPVHNESAVVKRSVERVLAYAALHPDHRFVFVDDGSTDATPRLLASALPAGGAVSCLLLAENCGKGGAIKRAVLGCGSEFVCFIDGDLAYSLDHLPNLLAALETHDVVIGSRLMVAGNSARTIASRKFMGRAFNFLVRASLGIPFHDTQAGIKGFRASAAERLFQAQRLAGFGFDVELLYLAPRMGLSVVETPVSVSEDHEYESSAVKLIRSALRMLREVAQIRRNDRQGLYDALTGPAAPGAAIGSRGRSRGKGQAASRV